MVSGNNIDCKATEQMLQESEERFHEWAAMFPTTVFEADLRGRVTYVNNHCRSRFGISNEAMENGLNLIYFVHPDDRKDVIDRISARVTGFKGEYLEYRARCSDGSVFEARAYSTPVTKEGVPVGVRGFILDISGQK